MAQAGDVAPRLLPTCDLVCWVTWRPHPTQGVAGRLMTRSNFWWRWQFTNSSLSTCQLRSSSLENPISPPKGLCRLFESWLCVLEQLMAPTQPATQISSLVNCQVRCLEETWLGVQGCSSTPSLAYALEQFVFLSVFN